MYHQMSTMQVDRTARAARRALGADACVRACSSLAFQRPEDVAETLALVKQAAITIVSLPLVNEWSVHPRACAGSAAVTLRHSCSPVTVKWRGV